MMRKTMLAVLMLVGTPLHAVSACNARVSNISPTISLVYDPVDGITRGPDISIELVNLSEEPCKLSLIPVNQEQNTLRGRKGMLAYELNPVGATPVTLEGGIGKRATLSRRIEVQHAPTGKSGNYRNSLNLAVIDAGSKRQVGRDQETLIDVAIPRRAQLNIAGANSAGSAFGVSRIDFGQMKSGAERSVYVQVRTTDDVDIHIRSRNAGTLQHVRLQNAAPAIPYGMEIDGVQIGLASPFVLRREVERGEASYLMTIRLGEVGHPPAGEYQDIVTIDVSAE